jgi:tetratricopeptide (TPR) repeat protein
VLEAACAIRPESCLQLGRVLAANGQDAAAARAYQRAVDTAWDRVSVANEIEWLVEYRYEHGSADKALELARMAAETYSSGGLLTLARLLEKMGRFEQAREEYEKESQRYQGNAELMGFYHRMARVRKQRAYASRLDELTQRVFPDGLARVELRGLSSPPRQGVLFKSSSPALHAAGLMAGAIVVALDGWGVRNLEQFQAVRAFSRSPEMKLIVWQEGRYREVEAVVNGRRFGVDVTSYPEGRR